MEADHPFRPFLEAHGVVILDGGLSNALEALGHDLDDPLWSARALLDAPDDVRAVHRAYLDAGADCIATASYQASYPGLRDAGLTRDDATEVLRRSVTLAVEERDRFHEAGVREDGLLPLVAASVGPYGAFLADGSEYDGQYGLSASELERFHRDRWRVLGDAGPDLMACETIPSAIEVQALLALIAEGPLFAWMSLSCSGGAHLADGSPLTEVAQLIAGGSHIAGVGVNCIHPDHVPALVTTLQQTVDVPVLAYPNSGEDYHPEDKCWTGLHDVSDWVRRSEEWVRSGARGVGGCCRIGPDTIRELRTRWSA